MSDTYLSDTIIIGGPNRVNIGENYREMVIGKARYIPEVVLRRKKPVKKILFLSANPHVVTPHYFAEEVRSISAGLLLADQQDRWEIQPHMTSQLRDLRRALLEHEPHIVHFIGQGEANGLFVEESLGIPLLISANALAGSFELCADTVECVILSAAYSEEQAQAICQHIDYVIGIPSLIKNKTAAVFTAAFYHALGVGKTIEEAFESALIASSQELSYMPHHPIPILKRGTASPLPRSPL